MPLEPYRARYTELLNTWEKQAFSKNFNVEVIESADPSVSLDIISGSVLDTYQRPIHALGQMQTLLRRMQTEAITPAVYASDFFHPGIEALAYIEKNERFGAFCWAQTFDQFDFTIRHSRWMRKFEEMALRVYSDVFVASPILQDLINTTLVGDTSSCFVHNVGLPFDSNHVFAQLGSTPAQRDIDVVYTSRFDSEKNPSFFLELVESCEDLNFAVCTGHPTLSSGDAVAIGKAHELRRKGKLQIFEGCTKTDYYNVLARSKVQFNCASQDWVSFTLLEALTFGCKPVYPMCRDFVEVFRDYPRFLYSPLNAVSAAERLYMVSSNHAQQDADYQDFRAETLAYHNGTLDRISEILAN